MLSESTTESFFDDCLDDFFLKEKENQLFIGECSKSLELDGKLIPDFALEEDVENNNSTASSSSEDPFLSPGIVANRRRTSTVDQQQESLDEVADVLRRDSIETRNRSPVKMLGADESIEDLTKYLKDETQNSPRIINLLSGYPGYPGCGESSSGGAGKGPDTSVVTISPHCPPPAPSCYYAASLSPPVTTPSQSPASSSQASSATCRPRYWRHNSDGGISSSSEFNLFNEKDIKQEMADEEAMNRQSTYKINHPPPPTPSTTVRPHYSTQSSRILHNQVKPERPTSSLSSAALISLRPKRKIMPSAYYRSYSRTPEREEEEEEMEEGEESESKPGSFLPPPRKYNKKDPESIEDIDEYRRKRERNNEAVRRARAKRKDKESQIKQQIAELKNEKRKLQLELESAQRTIKTQHKKIQELQQIAKNVRRK